MKRRTAFLFFALSLCAAPALAQGIGDVMDDLVARLTAEFEGEALNELDTATILRYVTPEEREVLASGYWTFIAPVPATVSILRSTGQSEVPFWLAESDFEKTDLTVANEYYTYEVWQQDFPAGPIGLGINGFDKHRPHYFVAVGPQDPNDEMTIEELYPPEFDVRTMAPGVLTYHDWTELVLEEVPESLRGHKLLTTIRGRAREAHIKGAFRETAYPAASAPDHVVLTWADDPSTTQAIQWRTDETVVACSLHYGPADAPGEMRPVRAEAKRITDRMLHNDRLMHRWTVNLSGLEPGTTYRYHITTGGSDTAYARGTFTTALAEDGPFSFVYLGDTHRQPAWGEMMAKVHEEYPDAAFYALAGDLVGTGLYRDDWDAFFALSTEVFSARPVVPCIGNHDDQDGLGAQMYLDFFALPENGPAETRAEGAFTLTYGDALFIILDIGADEEVQAQWLEEVLEASDETWKFAMFHFPPYDPEEDYPFLRERWGGLFERYGLDLVMTGHVHHYLRTKPINEGAFMEDPAKGTTYVTSIAIPYKSDTFEAGYAAVADYEGGPLYQVIEIDGATLRYKAVDSTGGVIDEFVIDKTAK